MSMDVLADILLLAGQGLLALAMLCALWRILAGPRAQDRILALDTLYVNALLSIIVFCIRTDSAVYMETALIMALLGFTGTMALAKFLMRGEVIE